MKVALVHELLTMKGGAEKVLRIVAQMFPDAPIYTLLYDEQKLGNWFPKERVRTSIVQQFANRLPLTAHRYNHHLYLKRFPSAVEAWDFSEFDVVLSFSSAFTHGIITNGKPKHLCYVHSPARYLWDRTQETLERTGKGAIGPLRRAYLSRTFHKLRTWDAESADRPNRLVAASKTVQRRIELYWRRESDVIHPPIDDFWFQQQTRSPNPESRIPYFFIASTLVRYKRIDLAIEACNRTQTRLKIAGAGPDRTRLQKLAGPRVEFLGFQSEDQLRGLYANARATIFPGEEDFGLVPLESLACGTPVIAFGGGGVLETMTRETAEFFDQPSGDSLALALKNFETRRFVPERCRERAMLFGRATFEAALRKEIAAI